ncbi:hypothetical protein DL93DRAFT_2163008 [Clavulina sp. PMI_390]|nr:hypothetical protein DL93DRAFT_2163008 [Clavulina sp. PMI_390]
MADEDYEAGWQTMESDPGVFTELLKTLGVDSLIVDDLYSLDDDSVAALQPVHAFIFLFKWVGASGDESSGGSGTYDNEFSGFFANQVVNNACATIAVMNGILNIPDLKMGEQLTGLQSFAPALDPMTRGEVITSDHVFRQAHNSLSPPPAVSLAELDQDRDKTKGDAYHFIVYLPHAGSIYELDGLKKAPIRHGSYSGEQWVGKAREAIEARIATYPPESLHFNLLAIRDDPLPKLQSQLAEAQSKNQSEWASNLLNQVSIENEKRERWKFENSLRRQNHLGTIHALLLAMAQVGVLDAAVDGAKKTMKEKIQKARERQAKGEPMDF